MSEEKLRPITVDELIKELEFIRDVAGGGKLEIMIAGIVSKDSKVYGATAKFSVKNSCVYIGVGDERAEIHPDFERLL